MLFLGQVPLALVGLPEKAAYVFVAHSTGEAWEVDPYACIPRSGSNALVVQQAAAGHDSQIEPPPGAERLLGQVLRRTHDGPPVEYDLILEERDEPEGPLSNAKGDQIAYFKALSGDKIGGRPAFSNPMDAEEFACDDWILALQLQVHFVPAWIQIGGDVVLFAMVNRRTLEGVVFAQE